MSLNVELLPGRQPNPYLNESFLLRRDGIKCEFSFPGALGGDKVSASGMLYISNIRLVFVATRPTPEFSALELPLALITEEKFKQPVFGVNALQGVCDPYEGRGLETPLKFWLGFYNGGCMMLLHYFINLLAWHRQNIQQMYLEQIRRQQQPQVPTFDATAFVQQNAFYDPNDPTVLYVSTAQSPGERPPTRAELERQERTQETPSAPPAYS